MLHTPLGTHTNKTCSPCRSGSHTSALSSPALHTVWQHAPFILASLIHSLNAHHVFRVVRKQVASGATGARVPATAPQRRATCSARPQLPPHTDTAQANELWRLARTYTHTHAHNSTAPYTFKHRYQHNPLLRQSPAPAALLAARGAAPPRTVAARAHSVATHAYAVHLKLPRTTPRPTHGHTSTDSPHVLGGVFL